MCFPFHQQAPGYDPLLAVSLRPNAIGFYTAEVCMPLYVSCMYVCSPCLCAISASSLYWSVSSVFHAREFCVLCLCLSLCKTSYLENIAYSEAAVSSPESFLQASALSTEETFLFATTQAPALKYLCLTSLCLTDVLLNLCVFGNVLGIMTKHKSPNRSTLRFSIHL